ncbi:universal stress protein [Celeribacter neptunius]|uniref:Nucleotide-binding universal stress protein, UspA family n=1 Tax=Celeribacter neptunius TaxID=588602 RepID=A0A1I3WW15_9RHOB|nr:universal stress protein [Celeribacter neptunius]SFK10601.1 Nucleotide-binding universal stress protein, UspA family [Celeribacter neptunius]
MTNTIVVAYDGSDSAVRALEFAVDRAKHLNGSVVVAYVLEWSPYQFLTPDEIEQRHKRRKEELKRAEEAVISPMIAKYADSGVPLKPVITYGHVAETLIKIVKKEEAVQLVVGRTGQSNLSTRLFGSVASSLAQSCPVALTILP